MKTHPLFECPPDPGENPHPMDLAPFILGKFLHMLQEVSANWGADERDKFQKEAEAERDQFWQGLWDAGLWQHLSPLVQRH